MERKAAGRWRRASMMVRPQGHLSSPGTHGLYNPMEIPGSCPLENTVPSSGQETHGPWEPAAQHPKPPKSLLTALHIASELEGVK